MAHTGTDYIREESLVTVTEGVGVVGSTDRSGPDPDPVGSGYQWSGPDGGQGVGQSVSGRVWSAELFCLHGPGAETQLKPRCSL